VPISRTSVGARWYQCRLFVVLAISALCVARPPVGLGFRDDGAAAGPVSKLISPRQSASRKTPSDLIVLARKNPKSCMKSYASARTRRSRAKRCRLTGPK